VRLEQSMPAGMGMAYCQDVATGSIEADKGMRLNWLNRFSLQYGPLIGYEDRLLRCGDRLEMLMSINCEAIAVLLLGRNK